MKAETKAKRRVTLSICGMGWLDESEIESIPNAKPVPMDLKTGEIVTVETEKKPEEFIDGGDILGLEDLLNECDEATTRAFYLWLNNTFKATSLREIPKSGFEKCVSALKNKIKYVKDQGNTKAVA